MYEHKHTHTPHTPTLILDNTLILLVYYLFTGFYKEWIISSLIPEAEYMIQKHKSYYNEINSKKKQMICIVYLQISCYEFIFYPE